MKKYLLKLIVSLGLIGFIFTGCDDGIDSSAIAEVKPFEEKSFTLKTLENMDVELRTKEYGVDFKEYKDKKVVLLNVFATWCPPCIKEIPALNTIQEKYKDDLQIISVLFKDQKTKQQMIDFKKEHNINYIITYGEENLKVSNEVYDVQKVPEMFLYTKEGVLVQKFVGETKADVIEKYIVQAINYKK